MKISKKIFFVFLLILIVLFCGCKKNISTSTKNLESFIGTIENSNNNYTSSIDINEPKFEMKEEEITKLYLNNELTLATRYGFERIIWSTDDIDIIDIKQNKVIGLKVGIACLRATFNSGYKDYYIQVIDDIEYIKITGKQNLLIGEIIKLEATVYPSFASQDVIWHSSDDKIATVNENGEVEALNLGIVKISAISNQNNDIYKEHFILVSEKDKIDISKINSEKEIDLGNYNELLKSIIDESSQCIIGVNNYTLSINNELKLSKSGSGVIYKRFCVYENGDKVLDDGTIDYNEVDHFTYYVITNKHIVIENHLLKVYFGKINDEIIANLIQYDLKIDLAVISFDSTLYFSVAKIGDSKLVETGDFVFAVGNPEGKDYYQTTTFGIVSSAKRYISVDTDNDNTNDWDAEYLQIDAPVNEGNSGGAVINLRGEVVGISSTRLSNLTIENMGFAIPTNLVMEIVEVLETGKQIIRPTMGITMILIKDLLAKIDYYHTFYPQYIVPNNISYGVYVTDVDKNKVASKAGLKVNDIILTFNGIEIRESHTIRLELNHYSIGSGDTAILEVYRDGEIITITLVF